MNKYTTLVTIFFVFLLLAGIPSVLAHNPTTNKDLLVIDSIGDPETVDPAWAYDTSSGTILQNVYDTLITYKRTYTDGPYTEGKIDEFVPSLATNVAPLQLISEVSPEGVEWNGRMTYTIRTGVTFHDGNTMTPADVEYSFERVLVQDRDGGPQWMLYFPLLGTYGGDTSDPDFGAKIDHAIESDATTVWFNFNVVLPELTIRQILAQTWGSVVEKSWAIAHGDFDDDFSHWTNYHNPTVSPLDNPHAMMGTGPYSFTDWTTEVSWQIDRYANYWGGWPLPIQDGSNARLPGYVSTILHKYNTVWTSRRANLLAGTADFTDVDRQFRDQVLGQPDIVCYYPFNVLSNTAAFYTFNITQTSDWIGATKTAEHVLGGDPLFAWGNDRIPLDLFNDPNVRYGFSYAFDYDGWLTASFLGEGSQPSSPIVSNLPFYNPANEKYHYDLTEAEYYLKLAWGGSGANPAHDPALVTPGHLWTSGMGFTITYNVGNVGRQTAAETWAKNLNTLRPTTFNIATAGIAWGGKYLPDMVASKLPIFVIGWLADYADPDNFVFPYMHSQGTFSAWQKYNNPHVDALITAGAVETNAAYNAAFEVADPITTFGWGTTTSGTIPPDATYPRQSIYFKIQRIYFVDNPGVILVEALGRHWGRGWVRGWFYNTLYPGFAYAYLFKQGTHLGDANTDGAVDVADLGWISGRWGAAGLSPAGSTANVQGDINGGSGGTTGSNKGPAPGIIDGLVDVIDLGLVSAYWDTGPTGPSHP